MKDFATERAGAIYRALHSQHSDEMERRVYSNGRLAEEILALYRPKSVVDVGCGIGLLLEEFVKRGIEGVGIEGEWLEMDAFAAPPETFHAHNLEEEMTLPRRFDLAVSIEVAEHLGKDRAEGFVQDLCKLSDVVVFSAAIPAQGGRGHRNEQWQSYWAQLFEDAGYLTYDPIRPNLRFDDEMFRWFRQNVLVFVKEGNALGHKLSDSRIAPEMCDMILPFFHEREMRKLKRKLKQARKG